jgi:hypothetical protein
MGTPTSAAETNAEILMLSVENKKCTVSRIHPQRGRRIPKLPQDYPYRAATCDTVFGAVGSLALYAGGWRHSSTAERSARAEASGSCGERLDPHSPIKGPTITNMPGATSSTKHVSMHARRCPTFAAVATDDVAADHLTIVELGDQGTAHTVAAGVCDHRGRIGI